MPRLYAANLAYTTLDVAINDAVTSFTVTDPANFSSDAPFIVSCESEIMYVGAINKVTRTFSTVTRGYEGTTPAAHAIDKTISNKITAGYLNNMYTYIDGKVDSTGGSITGPLDITATFDVVGAVGIVGETSITGGLTMITSTTSTISGRITNAKIGGGSLRTAFDANNQIIGKPVIKDYEETIVDLTTLGSTAITLNLAAGNIYKAVLGGNITGIDITNASTVNTNSVTLDLVSKGAYSIAWMAPVAVATASTVITALTTDESFNTTSVFSSNVKPGDIVTCSGWSTANAPLNNASFRIATASTKKLTCTTNVTARAAGDTVTITRRKEFFADATVPDAPTAFIPTGFVMWSHKDPTRWRIAKTPDF